MKQNNRLAYLIIFFALMAVVLACGRNRQGAPDQPPEAAPADSSPAEDEPDAPAPASSQQDCTDSMAFVADVSIPDGFIINENEPFIKTWRIQNNGDCFWTGYSLQFESGEPMGTLEQPIPDTPAGEELDISVEMTSPGGAGNYSGYWAVLDSGGNSLGRLSCVIVVPSADAVQDPVDEDPSEPDEGGDAGAPAAPTGFNLVSGNSETYLVTWTDNSNNEDGFKIRKVGIGWLKNPTGPDATQFNIHYPRCGTSQDYRVVAFNASGNSGPSNTLTLNGLPCP